MAYHLAPSGKKILILERGGFLPKEEDNWSTKAVFTDAKYKTKEAWHDKDGKEFHPGIHYYVGGNTKIYGAVLLRFRKEDFGEIKHHGGTSLAWPIQYDDLEQYYTAAEKLYCVHGEAGIDPTEPVRSEPYPYPPLSHEPRIQELYDDFKRIGHHPFPLPIGVRLGRDESYPQPEYIIGKFDGFPDPTGSKSDAHVRTINPALKHENVTLLTNCYVERLVTDLTGRKVKSVHVVQNG